jgi:hypothetical protein
VVDVFTVVIVALVVFAVVLTGALWIMLRALDAQAEARQERLLEALTRLSTAPSHVDNPPVLRSEPKRDRQPTSEPRPLAVRLGAEVVELDPEIVARIEALTGTVQGGAPGVLEAAIALGIATAEGGGDRDSAVSPIERPKLRLVQDESGREQEGDQSKLPPDDDDDNGGGPSAA